jgi:hypothetical protein
MGEAAAVEATVATDDFNEDPYNVKGSQTSEAVTSEMTDAGQGEEAGGDAQGATKTGQEPKKPEDEGVTGEPPAAGEAAKKDGEQGDEGKTASPDGDGDKADYSKRVQKRLDHLTWQRAEAERRARAAETELQQLRDKLAKLEGSKTPDGDAGKTEPGVGKGAADEAPKREDFADMDDFIVAKAKYEVKQELRQELAAKEAESAEKERKALEARAQEEDQQIWEEVHAQEAERKGKYWERLQEGKVKYEDFDTVVFGPDSPFNNPDVNQALVDAIVDSDVPADLAYHFNAHPEDVARMAIMNPVQIGKEVALLETRFKKTAEPAHEEQQRQPKKQSGAPDPITPVKPSASHKKKPDDMTMDEYREWRESEG